MEPRVGIVGRICFVRWYVTATKPDIRLAVGAMLDARREVGSALVFVGVFPPGLAIPDHETRLEIMRLVPIVDRICDSYFIALPGNGPAEVLMRSGFGILHGLIRMPFTVLRSIDETFEAAAKAAGMSPVDVASRARALGIVDDEVGAGVRGVESIRDASSG